MALTFDLSDVNQHDQLDPNSGTLKSLLLLTMVIGIGEITPKNWQEFFFRMQTLEAVHGPMLDGGKYFTADDIKRYIGLKTNVFPKVSSRRFETQMGAAALERLRKEYKGDG